MKSHPKCDSLAPPPGDLVKIPFVFMLLMISMALPLAAAEEKSPDLPVVVVTEDADPSPDPRTQSSSLALIPMPDELPVGMTLATLARWARRQGRDPAETVDPMLRTQLKA